MPHITIHQAKTHLSRLIQRALEGEEIVIGKRNEPLVRLEVIRPKLAPRRFGGLKSMVVAMGPSFDEPVDDFVGYAPENLAQAAEQSAEYRP